MLAIQTLRALTDNYIYCLTDSETKTVAVIDPSEAAPVERALDKVDWIFNTHHHWDHVGGNEQLKEHFGCRIVCSPKDAPRVPGVDAVFDFQQGFTFGSRQAQIFSIPGHTLGHVALFFESERALFCGDTLFALGCGKLFEGDPPMMWNSLSQLRRLPPDTKVYCAHEYTLNNAKFALAVYPDDRPLQQYVANLKRKFDETGCTLPTLLQDELRFNPFLQADDPRMAQAMGKPGASAVEVFAEIRKRKDNF